MRDPQRIRRILIKIYHVWDAYPDLRLIQLLYDAKGYVGNHHNDAFHVEDDVLEKGLDFIINAHKKENEFGN